MSCVCVCVCVCACVCARMCERERERERKRVTAQHCVCESGRHGHTTAACLQASSVT